MTVDDPRPLVLPDVGTLHDWSVLTGRAQRLDEDAAMRLSVHGDVLVLSVAPLYPHGLGDSTPLALGMRMLRLADPSHDGLDVVVPAAALSDRFARARSEDSLSIPVPPQEVRVSWTGISPPRGPWGPAGTLPTESLRAAARAGIEEVAAGTPQVAGSHAVSALRRQVWARPIEVAGASGAEDGGAVSDVPVPAAVAFAMEGLGFLAAEAPVEVRTSGPWVRVSSPVGHVLTRVH